MSSFPWSARTVASPEWAVETTRWPKLVLVLVLVLAGGGWRGWR